MKPVQDWQPGGHSWEAPPGAASGPPPCGPQGRQMMLLVLLFSGAVFSVRLCDPVDCSTLLFPVLHYLPELAQTHVH